MDLELLVQLMSRLKDKVKWSKYLYTARLFFLSKTKSAYPPIEKIREISILPAVTKIIETLLFIELQKRVVENKLIGTE